jgi:signal peptidase I
MNRKTARRLLRIISRVPGLYAFLAFAFAHRISVWGPSMEPTLSPGERVLFDRLAFVRDPVRKDDIVLLVGETGLRYVKRITAVPGDVSGDDLVLGRGEYWVEGDNGAQSTDSRHFGPVRRSQILGRAWVRYWPTERWKVWD